MSLLYNIYIKNVHHYINFVTGKCYLATLMISPISMAIKHHKI